MATTWKGLVWMWKLCHSSIVPVSGVLSVHSSTEFSAIVMSVRLALNSLPFRGNVGWWANEGTRPITIVRWISTWALRRSVGFASGAVGIGAFSAEPVETTFTSV